MMWSSSPIRNHEGTSRQSGCSPDAFGERLLRRGALRCGHQCGLRRGHVLAEHVVEAVQSDVEVGRSVAPRHRPRRLLAEHAAREHARELEAVLTGLWGESIGVDEPDDLAGVGGDVGDHHAAVGVGGEHDGPVDRADDVRDGGGVRGEAAQRVGGGDHRMSGVEQRIDDGVPARGLGERAVDENDGGLHGKLLSGWGQSYLADWLSQSSKWVGAMRASSPGVRDSSSSSAPK